MPKIPSYRDFATTLSGAKILMRYRGVSGSSGVGNFRPITRYSLKVPVARIFESLFSLQRQKRKRKL